MSSRIHGLLTILLVGILTFVPIACDDDDAETLDTPVLVSTYDVDGQVVTYTWPDITFAEAFAFQIAATDDFSDLLVEEEIAEPAYLWDVTTVSTDTYYARVKALGEGDYENSGWSNVVEVQVVGGP